MRNKLQYSEEWNDKIRPRILERDNYKCKHCGIKHRSYVLVDSSGNFTIITHDEYKEYKPFGAKCYRIFLQVAHLDNNKDNNDDTNLLALCVRCHLRLDAKYKNLLRLSDKKKKL